MPKKKNIIILISILAILIFVYFFFIRSPSPDVPSLTTSSTQPMMPGSAAADATTGQNLAVAQDFLTLLLNVKNIRLDDAIFSDPAFSTLRDSTIILVPDGTEGRPNPFAPIGFENLGASVGTTTAPKSTTTATGGSMTVPSTPKTPTP